MNDKKTVLTEEQEKVVAIDEGINLVLAPAGSGKTELLAERVIRALDRGHDSQKMACLTFTIRAGKNMLERVNKKYPQNQVTIGNIHSVCARLLLDCEVVPSNTRVIDQEESGQIIKEIAAAQKIQMNQPQVLAKYATYLTRKAYGLPETHLMQPGSLGMREEDALEVAREYFRAKKRHRYMDYDDILTYAYRWIKGADYPGGRFDWLQIDEVQDLNPIQFDIIQGLAEKGSVQVYFGDYNQAIYGFMGARTDSIRMLMDLAKGNQGAVYFLSKNFRSPSYLLDLFNDYLEKNLPAEEARSAKPSRIQDAPKDALGIFECSRQNQYEVICEDLIPAILHKFSSEEEDNIAVLVKTNGEANDVAKNLKGTEIKFFKISGYDLFQRASIKGLMAYLEALEDKFDRLAWTRLLYAFGIFDTLGKSRNFVHRAYGNACLPEDLLRKAEQKSTSLEDFVEKAKERPIVVFDTETTGLDTSAEDVIQIAAVKLCQGKKIGELDVYIQTEKDLTESEKIHHISREKLDKEGLGHREGLFKFLDFCGQDALLVAHNLQYDFEILSSNIRRYVGEEFLLEDLAGGRDNFFDSLVFAKLLYPDLPRYKLEFLIEHLGLQGENTHNALDDTRATAELVQRLLSDAAEALQRQETFLLENEKLLQRIREKLQMIFGFYASRRQERAALSSLVGQFMEALEASSGEARFQDRLKEDRRELEKLTRHMDLYTEQEPYADLTLGEKARKFLPLYREFKEGDLYIGDEKVLISTIHKAKGLEFDSVIIPNIGQFKKNNPRDPEEDARLLYVGITRAKKRLYLVNPDRNLPELARAVAKHFRICDYRGWSSRKR